MTKKSFNLTVTNPAQVAEILGVHNVKGDPRLRGNDPRAINWTERQERAAVPFEVIDGLPINPRPRADLKPGKGELRHWGEAVCSDAIVFAEVNGERRLLLIERGDGHGWAIPGGGLDEGERPENACVRELVEETGVVVSVGDIETMLDPRVVEDPRAGENAWMVTFPGVIYLKPDDLRPAAGQDDAIDADWFPARTMADVVAAVAERGGKIFPAHVDLIKEALAR